MQAARATVVMAIIAAVAAWRGKFGMSAPAVRERVLKLEEAGVVRGYRIELEMRGRASSS